MVKKFGEGGKTKIKADVIILGCTLPGIVTAHKLKSKFGDSMDIMVLDIPTTELPRISSSHVSKFNVAFQEPQDSDSDNDDSSECDYTAKRELLDNVARFYLRQYAKEFRVPLPDAIINPEGSEADSTSSSEILNSTSAACKAVVEEHPKKSRVDVEPEIETKTESKTEMKSETESKIEPETETRREIKIEAKQPRPPKQPKERIPRQKLFEYPSGGTVKFLNNIHDFEYLNYLEKFELHQYHSYLDNRMRQLFQTNYVNPERDNDTLLYYDQTTMEKNILDTLLFSTSREIMRIIVRLVCGAPANSVSLLFYLHQCYRTSSSRNHIGGMNTRCREKLLGNCKKRLSCKLQQSVADITLQSSIKEIRTYSEQVILETMKGETTYTCSLLAMAVRPEQLSNIQVEGQLLPDETANIIKDMIPGRAKKFSVKYKENFWGTLGYSGDIFSMRGPIIWAMERPRLSTTGSLEKYSELIGFLVVRDDIRDSKEAVLDQLVRLFGYAAAHPVRYRETRIADIYVPGCGDYVALRRLTGERTPKLLEWGALDIFADGDVAAALEAGHTAYLHMLAFLRPQAQSYDDIITGPYIGSASRMRLWLARINIISGIKMTIFTAALVIGVSLMRSYMRK